MGQQVIKQPDGLLSVFDTSDDTFVLTGATSEQVVAWRVREAADAARKAALREVERVTEGKRAYHQFTLSWKEAVERAAASEE
ncbi:hypothetical protein [Streptomyces sp. NPDC088925]|uniref:hypothetical protein n=1 Tax=Streptomyces sp. NPDC088925 TaxID=3365914 RepID=UPI00380E2897